MQIHPRFLMWSQNADQIILLIAKLLNLCAHLVSVLPLFVLFMRIFHVYLNEYVLK